MMRRLVSRRQFLGASTVSAVAVLAQPARVASASADATMPASDTHPVYAPGNAPPQSNMALAGRITRTADDAIWVGVGSVVHKVILDGAPVFQCGIVRADSLKLGEHVRVRGRRVETGVVAARHLWRGEQTYRIVS